MGHEDNSLGSVVNGIFDCWDGSGDALVVGDLLIRIEGDVEVDLFVGAYVSASSVAACSYPGDQLTLIKTLLSLSSTSVIDSLLERDIVAIRVLESS